MSQGLPGDHRGGAQRSEDRSGARREADAETFPFIGVVFKKQNLYIHTHTVVFFPKTTKGISIYIYIYINISFCLLEGCQLTFTLSQLTWFASSFWTWHRQSAISLPDSRSCFFACFAGEDLGEGRLMARKAYSLQSIDV